MEKKVLQNEKKTSKRNNIWSYSLINYLGVKVTLCREFILKLFQISQKRLRNIQNKFVKNSSLHDKRGRHNKRYNKIDPKIWADILDFISSLPKQKSHYQNTEKEYFLNPELTMKKIFYLFCETYFIANGKEFKLSYESLRIFFKHNVNISFRSPRKDVCNFCFKVSQSGFSDDNEKFEYEAHIKKVKLYKDLKYELLANSIYRLCLEFDFMQNKALPFLPCSEVFYKRLLWLYIFNIHVHNADLSYIFHALEGMFSKGPNSVCSYLYFVISSLRENIENFKDLKELIFFSDATSAQNRNSTVLKFCIFLSIKFNIKITQIFPVRGHSYCKCDSNFSNFSNLLKKVEIVEIPQKYIDILNSIKKFTVLNEKVYDFESFLKPYFKLTNKLNISKAVKIEYFNDGNINISKTYDNSEQNLINLLKVEKNVILNLNCNDIPIAKRVGINVNKKNDVLSLTKYLSDENRDFYTNYFNNLMNNDDVNDIDLSENEY
jgi:hypothetical protein